MKSPACAAVLIVYAAMFVSSAKAAPEQDAFLLATGKVAPDASLTIVGGPEKAAAADPFAKAPPTDQATITRVKPITDCTYELQNETVQGTEKKLVRRVTRTIDFKLATDLVINNDPITREPGVSYNLQTTGQATQSVGNLVCIATFPPTALNGRCERSIRVAKDASVKVPDIRAAFDRIKAVCKSPRF